MIALCGSTHLICLCSDDLLLSDDAGWGGFLDGRQRQTASRALLPRSFADAADAAAAAAAGQQLPSSFAESLTSPVQPSPQGPYDTHWLRCNGEVALRHAPADAPLPVCLAQSTSPCLQPRTPL